MNLSILIPTHNRPHLFARCLNSVLDQITPNVEVVVSNDSRDVIEIEHPQVKYYYNEFDSLCEIYQFLLQQAIGEYVYYLEDDDYLLPDFLISLEYGADMIAGNYYPTYETTDKLIYPRLYKPALVSPKEFLDNLNEEHLQLSQHVYKRSTIVDFTFPKDSHINNDILLTKHAANNCTVIQTTNKIFYYQTIDGGDNISFL
jgi:glycosyltransferase involved in cell wall biosynthesis